MGKSLVYRPNVVTSNYEPKKDCFAHHTTECTALNSLYCEENPNCHFYKKKGDDDDGHC